MTSGSWLGNDTPPAPAGDVAEDERLARLALSRVVEPGSREVHRQLELTSAVEVWDAVRSGAPLGQLSQQSSTS